MMKMTDYSNSTQKYISAVRKFLKDKYGKVNAEWEKPIELLADNLDLYKDCKESIAANGLMLLAKNGCMTKNPLIKTQSETQVQIQKLLTEFGLTPKAQAKINLPTDDEDELKDLLGGD